MEKYLEYFYDIAAIPHGSRNTKKISDFIKCFAMENNLRYRQDENNNIIVFKDASQGYEDHEPVILQAHIDMVAVKEPGCPKDMENEGLDLYVDGNFMKARGTSLGGDDGIGVAYMMALLGGDYEAPALECIFTSDEEIGMLGAFALDVSDITSRRMINLDHEDDKIFIVSCAGGAEVHFNIPVNKDVYEGTVYEVKVDGLKGGHSGCDIHLGRGNAIKVLCEELCKLNEKIGFTLIEINGGEADNVIPSSATARIMLTGSLDNSLFEREIMALNGMDFYFGNATDYDQAILSVKKEGKSSMISMDDEGTKRVLKFLSDYPTGVVAMSEANPEMVETSLNLGKVTSEEESVKMISLIRSSVDADKDALVYKLCKQAKDNGVDFEMCGGYPGWAYKAESPLRETMIRVFEEKRLCKPTVMGIHAGLECGVFSQKLPGLDCVAIGPDSLDIHSTKERLDLDTAKYCFDYLTEVLKQL